MRVVRAARKGLSRARNLGVAETVGGHRRVHRRRLPAAARLARSPDGRLHRRSGRLRARAGARRRRGPPTCLSTPTRPRPAGALRRARRTRSSSATGRAWRFVASPRTPRRRRRAPRRRHTAAERRGPRLVLPLAAPSLDRRVRARGARAAPRLAHSSRSRSLQLGRRPRHRRDGRQVVAHRRHRHRAPLLRRRIVTDGVVELARNVAQRDKLGDRGAHAETRRAPSPGWRSASCCPATANASAAADARSAQNFAASPRDRAEELADAAGEFVGAGDAARRHEGVQLGEAAREFRRRRRRRARDAALRTCAPSRPGGRSRARGTACSRGITSSGLQFATASEIVPEPA